MPAKVILEVVSGAIAGKRFVFDSHNLLLFGRLGDCQAQLSNDGFVSRHHFILEVSPPAACLRDLGSQNGTIIDGVHFGGRSADETPEQGAAKAHPSVPLRHGAKIVVGKTTIVVHIEGASPGPPPLPRRTTAEPTPKDPAALQIPGYELGTVLGTGGMGIVQRGKRRRDGLHVAVKLMQAAAAGDDDAKARFAREIDSLRRLAHSGIVRLFEHGNIGGAYFFVMEFCSGGSANRLRAEYGGKLPLSIATPIMLQVLQGLAYAHSHKFVHRDIKPENLLLRPTADGWSACLGDFGLAKNFESAGLSGMTAMNQRGGTIYFQPREQLTNYRDVKPASDVWSAAATFYHLLTGQYVRDFEKVADPVLAILQEPGIPIQQRNPSIPNPLAQVIDGALVDDPAQRPQDAAELLRAIAKAIGAMSIPPHFTCNRVRTLDEASDASEATRKQRIERVPEHLTPPFEAYRGNEPFIFVSYSHRDSAAVFRELEYLRDQGFRIWYDEGIEPGGEWPQEIAVALKKAAYFLVYISPDSVQSRNVRNEVDFALDHEKPFLAVHLSATELPSGLQLRTGNLQAIMRFRFAHDAYCAKLLRALPANLRKAK